MKLPERLIRNIQERQANNALRLLDRRFFPIDFSSNDYLSFAREEYQVEPSVWKGAAASRVLVGNLGDYYDTEEKVAAFHNFPNALIYPSGYMANIGLLSSILLRGDVIFYDEQCHASIKDGIRLSFAKSYPFKHNNLNDLKQKYTRFRSKESATYIVTESVFSMDGDIAPLPEIVKLVDNNTYIIVDEAHAVGVIGKKGEGLASALQLDDKIFAKVVTFGKAIGAQGAAVLSRKDLNEYLINYSRPFVYTTGLPRHTLQAIRISYALLENYPQYVGELQLLIDHYNRKVQEMNMKHVASTNQTAIQHVIIPGNDAVKDVAKKLQVEGFDIRPILSPTVKKGTERLRICIHRHNTTQEIDDLLQYIQLFLM